ncbi:MAG: GlsB/YeaQ/YmgE family stress response membrane protein [Verrucomicrobiales bacterium]|nr:GlsB/YeaQ/YmgE family stress response membrane protein [Verrucomicrobiales bacterium]
MSFFTWIILGLVAGALAKFLLPGKQPGGLFVTILIGIAGALIGGYLGQMLGWSKVQSFDLWSILLSTGGAIILLLVYGAIQKNKTSGK